MADLVEGPRGKKKKKKKKNQESQKDEKPAGQAQKNPHLPLAQGLDPPQKIF